MQITEMVKIAIEQGCLESFVSDILIHKIQQDQTKIVQLEALSGQLLRALDAIHFYVDATDQELDDRDISRDFALRDARAEQSRANLLLTQLSKESNNTET